MKCVALGLLLASLQSAALGAIGYGVADKPWDESLGSQRAVVQVLAGAGAGAGAVRVQIPWRRRDAEPAKKAIILVDATTNKPVRNFARAHINREAGTILFVP